MTGLSRAHYMPPSPRAPTKWDLKGVIRLIVVLLLFGLLIWGVLKLATKPKTVATSEQIWNAISAQGYEPQDITESYYNHDSGFKNVLLKCIAFEKDDIHFEFFDFNNNNSAIDIYSQAYTDITLLIALKLSIRWLISLFTLWILSANITLRFTLATPQFTHIAIRKTSLKSTKFLMQLIILKHKERLPYEVQ